MTVAWVHLIFQRVLKAETNDNGCTHRATLKYCYYLWYFHCFVYVCLMHCLSHKGSYWHRWSSLCHWFQSCVPSYTRSWSRQNLFVSSTLLVWLFLLKITFIFVSLSQQRSISDQSLLPRITQLCRRTLSRHLHELTAKAGMKPIVK